MGMVSVPGLLVLPVTWSIGGQFDPRLWLAEWQPWQYAGACLPRAAHLLHAKAAELHNGDYGELRAGLVHLTGKQADALAAAEPGRLTPGPWAAPLPVEFVYPSGGRWVEPGSARIDPADALTVVLFGAALRLEAAGMKDAAASVGAGMVMTALCSGSEDAFCGSGQSSFAATWKTVGGLAEAGVISLDDWPTRMADVPAWLERLRADHADAFGPKVA
jgi:hypothetical protein